MKPPAAPIDGSRKHQSGLGSFPLHHQQPPKLAWLKDRAVSDMADTVAFAVKRADHLLAR